jgi:hypothetical protein
MQSIFAPRSRSTSLCRAPREYVLYERVVTSSLNRLAFFASWLTRCFRSSQVQVFASNTNKVKKTIARFKDVVYSGHMREDGQLLVAGDESGLVQVCTQVVGSHASLCIHEASAPSHRTHEAFLFCPVGWIPFRQSVTSEGRLDARISDMACSFQRAMC